MSELIPTIPWTELVKIAKKGKLKELKSCEVTFNGEYQGTFIIPHGDDVAGSYGRIQAEYLGVKTNITGGTNPEELIYAAVPV